MNLNILSTTTSMRF